MVPSSALTIAVHLTNRCVHVFDQDPEEVVVQNLARIDPERFFTETTWAVGGHHHVSTFLTRQILRLELRSAHLPPWSFSPGLDVIQLVSLEDFESRANEVRRLERNELKQPRSDVYEALAVLEDCTGCRIPIRVLAKSVSDEIRERRLAHLLEQPCLHVRKDPETSILINTSNLVGVFSYPGLPERPTKAMETGMRFRSPGA